MSLTLNIRLDDKGSMMLVFIVLLHSIPVFLIGATWKSDKMVTVLAAGISAVLAILTSPPVTSIAAMIGITIVMWLSFVAINFSKRFAVTHRASLALTKNSESPPEQAQAPALPSLAHPAWAFTAIPLVAVVAYISIGTSTNKNKVESVAASAATAATAASAAAASAAASTLATTPAATEAVSAASALASSPSVLPAAVPSPIAAPIPAAAAVAPVPESKPVDPAAQQNSKAARNKRPPPKIAQREQRAAPSYQPPPELVKARETVNVNFPGIDQNSQEYRWRVDKEVLRQGSK